MYLCAVLMSPLSSSALQTHGGPSPPSRGGLGTVLRAGPLGISIDQVAVTTCFRRQRGGPATPTQPGWEWLETLWVLRNSSNRVFAIPHANHPGFRLVSSHRLYPGFYASYPGYGSEIAPHSKEMIWWTFAIHRGTKHVILTYLPPGPHAVLWSIAVPRPPAHCG